VTPSGRIVQVDQQLDGGVKSAPMAPTHGALPVYVHVASDKIKVGHPSGNGEPTRHPFRAFNYRLITGELGEADPADCLKVGEVVFGDARPVLSSDYIPPCMEIRSHPLLADQCRRLYGLLTLVQQGAVSGFQSFAAVSQDKPGKFGAEHRWFQDMLAGLAIHLGGLLRSHPVPEQPISPYYMINHYRQVFGIVDAMMETYKEAAITLRKKYADNELFKRFLDGVKDFLRSGYDHHQLGPQATRLVRLMTDFVEFINMINILAGALPQVGLVMNYRNREYRLQTFGAVASTVERDGVTVKIDGLANVTSRDVLVGINRDLFSGVDYRYIMVRIGLNENNIPGRMDPVYVDAESAGGSLILKPMDDLACPTMTALNLNFKGNFNPQDLKNIPAEMINVYIY
jgi:hypothetical protein